MDQELWEYLGGCGDPPDNEGMVERVPASD